MKDYQFGEKIYKLRKQRGFSQNQLGELLGLSGKTVSKWENGGAKPQLDTMKKLSKIFGVSVDELLCMDEQSKSVTKIVITGGPCAGKTTALSHVQEFFTKMGYHVIIVPETATELIMGGVTPWGLNTNLDYQMCQMALQLEKEKVFLQAAQKVFHKDKILVVCDRGTMDNKAYMNDAEFSWVLSSMGLNYTEIRDRYDAVFHLVTAAKGAVEFYTTANNTARTESVAEALELDKRSAAAWAGHKYYRTIDNSTDFAGKLLRLTKAVEEFIKKQE